MLLLVHFILPCKKQREVVKREGDLEATGGACRPHTPRTRGRLRGPRCLITVWNTRIKGSSRVDVLRTPAAKRSSGSIPDTPQGRCGVQPGTPPSASAPHPAPPQGRTQFRQIASCATSAEDVLSLQTHFHPQSQSTVDGTGGVPTGRDGRGSPVPVGSEAAMTLDTPSARVHALTCAFREESKILILISLVLNKA